VRLLKVHRILGPGLLESIYERCLIRELEMRGISCTSQQKVIIDYKGFTFEETLRFDVLYEIARRPTWLDSEFP
jgi:GxxExxY protein